MRGLFFFIVCLVFVACKTSDPGTESIVKQEFVGSVLRPTLDTLITLPENKLFGIRWTNKIWDGYYRGIFTKTKPDLFRDLNDIDSVNFNQLRLVIQDSLPFCFENEEGFPGVVFFNEEPDSNSRKDYLLIEASASPIVLGEKTGLVYVEISETSYHNGEGVLCELKSSSGKWSLSRIISAWSMRRDSIRLGVFH